MKKAKLIKTITRGPILFIFIFWLAGCAPTTPRKFITELYSPKYNANYNYQPKQQQTSPSGFTVGILSMKFDFDSTTYLINSDLDKQYTKNFEDSFSTTLEKILMSKGIAVLGPFESYEEMTYPERKRCDFLIQPTIKLTLDGKFYNPTDLHDYSGPEGQNWKYRKADYDMTANAKMQYVIYDPLTAEKLERHKIESDEIARATIILATQLYSTNKKGEISKEWWESLDKRRTTHPNYHNTVYLYGEVLDDLFTKYMSKVDYSLTVDEFVHLKKYIEELEKKKRF